MNSDISQRAGGKKNVFTGVGLVVHRPYGPEQVQHVAARHCKGGTTAGAVNNSM